MQSKWIKIINKILKKGDMNIKLDERQIIIDTWRMYLKNYLKGWTWSQVYKTTKTEAHNSAIHQMWKEQNMAKRKAEAEAETAKIAASGQDIHNYTMNKYYSNKAYSGD